MSDLSKNKDQDVVLATKKYRRRNQFVEIFYSVRRNPGAFTGLIILCALALTLLYSFIFISWADVVTPNAMNRFQAPSWQFPFGTDQLGRNLLLRTLYGTRYSLLIGVTTVGGAVIIGVSLGSFAAYFGGKIDDIIMRICDTVASIPGIILGMVIVSVLGQSLQNLIIAVTVSFCPMFIRMSRAAILTVKNQEFVEAARAIGLSTMRIIYTQVLPNGLSPIIVSITVNLGTAIMVAAGLSFLGFGVPIPAPEWGSLISTGREFARTAPWLMLFPGLFIMMTVLSFNLLGDGLRDALDPKLKRR